ncbi:MAG: fatty acid desaturase [bacterium]
MVIDAAGTRASAPEPTVKEARAALPAFSRQRSTARGLAHFGATLAVYLIHVGAVFGVSTWGWRVPLALLNGLTIGMLFIVGHDACHGSLTSQSSLNKWLARIAFLPSLHPLAAWEYSHNAMHHGWTNLRGRDPVYAPLTIEEYSALSPRRRRFERLCRSWVGMLPLYLVTIWWSLEMAPSSEHRRHIDKRGTFPFDRTLVLAFIALECVVAVLRARALSGATLASIAAVTATCVVVPFLSFAWLMGFATFQHHTHPRVRWYADETEWTYFRSQVQGTVHIVFPPWLEQVLHHIMEHTAHHVDTRVPLYNLVGAQRAVEEHFGAENVIAERFSFRGMSRTFRECQLYDYRRHTWMTFAGETIDTAE